MSIDHVQAADPEWYKPTRPFIESGGAIRLTWGASQKPYDPWQQFRAPTRKARRIKTLWGGFAELVRFIQADQLALYHPSPAGVKRILKWSSEFGLLGILPNQVHKIVLAATYRMEKVDQQLKRQTIVQPIHSEITGGNWITTYQRTQGDSSGFKAGALVPSESLPTGMGEPEWSIRDGQDMLGLLPTHSSDWKRYFSKRFKNDQFPCPLSVPFWASYQEPINRWMVSAVAFQKAIMLVSECAKRRYSKKASSGATDYQANIALWLLNSFAAGVSSRFEFGAYAIQRRRCAGSLLSIMARMFFEDLLKNRLAYECLQCKALFVSKDRKSRYCSTRCRNTASVGRYRAKLGDRAPENASMTQRNARRNAK